MLVFHLLEDVHGLPLQLNGLGIIGEDVVGLGHLLQDQAILWVTGSEVLAPDVGRLLQGFQSHAIVVHASIEVGQLFQRVGVFQALPAKLVAHNVECLLTEVDGLLQVAHLGVVVGDGLQLVGTVAMGLSVVLFIEPEHLQV